jgi:hypothetical protein
MRPNEQPAIKSDFFARLLRICHKVQSPIMPRRFPPPWNARRFPPPWSVEELDACFVVRDRDGQALAYVYFEDEPGRRSAAKLLSKDAARLGWGHLARLHGCIGACSSMGPAFVRMRS